MLVFAENVIYLAVLPAEQTGVAEPSPLIVKDWLGGLDSNQDSQIQSLESYRLDDLPVDGPAAFPVTLERTVAQPSLQGTKTNRSTFPRIGPATILPI